MTWRHSDPEARYGVYVAYDMRCFWCNRPIEYINLTIDHVIPSSTPLEDLPHIRSRYGLSDDFLIEDFRNWVSAHMLCNRRKSADLYNSVPAMLATLAQTVKKGPEALGLAERVRRDQAQTKALLLFEAALKKGTLSIEASQDVIRRVATEPSGWRVLQQRDGVETVTDGKVTAHRPTMENNDLSWICGNCHQPGPWVGNMCTVCGVRSAPD